MNAFFALSLLLPVNAFAIAMGGSTSVGPGHPSAYICPQLGAQSVGAERKPDGGQSGYCRFADGAYADQLTLWRGFKGTLAARHLLASDFVANHEVARSKGWQTEEREQRYCEHLGGQVMDLNETTRKTSAFQICAFADRSTLDTGSLYWGASYAPELTKVAE